MKKTLTLVCSVLAVISTSNAQNADEIISNYFETIGGYESWGTLEGLKMSAKLNQGGMEIPLEIVMLKDGKQYTKFSVQGNEFMQGVFDGETVWSTNFQSLTAEKADQETMSNQKLDANDFPSDLYDYKAKGYQVELLGEETIEGAETFKIKLTKEPMVVDGEQVEDVSFMYFDKENFVLLAEESEILTGAAKGTVSFATFSDFDEVNGLYFPFSISQGVKGGVSQPIIISEIETNPEVDPSVFSFPTE